jgi:hypothetical protein
VAPIVRGAKWAGRGAAVVGGRGAKWAKSRGEDLLERLPTDEIEESVRESVSEARDRIDGFVRSELDDLRRALRKQRKRLGI